MSSESHPKRDGVVERWLQGKVEPTVDRYRADPITGASLDEEFGRLAKRMSIDMPEVPSSVTDALS